MSDKEEFPESAYNLLDRWLGLLDDGLIDTVTAESQIALDTQEYLKAQPAPVAPIEEHRCFLGKDTTCEKCQKWACSTRVVFGPKLEAKWRRCEPEKKSKEDSVFEFLVSLYTNTETRINDLGECEAVLPENLIRGWIEEHDAAILKSSPKEVDEFGPVNLNNVKPDPIPLPQDAQSRDAAYNHAEVFYKRLVAAQEAIEDFSAVVTELVHDCYGIDVNEKQIDAWLRDALNRKAEARAALARVEPQL